MLQIHFSNRFETLSGQLLARLGPGRGDVFAADTVIVPSAAVRRALTLALADAHGICAQVNFGFLAAWLWLQIGQSQLPGDTAPARHGPAGLSSPLAAPSLVWRIHSALLDPAFVAAHPRLLHYLSGADDVMRFELAGSIASLFEQYQSYRADWLQAWLFNSSPTSAMPLPAGADSAARADLAWQVALWRRIHQALGTAAPGADPVLAFGQALARSTAALPATRRAQPVHVFALPTMPPLHRELLQTLGRVVDVHVYVLNPCQEHWFELIDRKRLSHLARRGRAEGFEEGNRLLAAWGRQTQAHVDLLVESCGPDVQDDAHFEPNPNTSLLAQLHNSILELTELVPGSVLLAADDRSIELHVCHSLTRELEVLHDHLLGLFVQAEHAAGPTLLPSQVLVVLPDLQAAAPLIDAVFGTAARPLRMAYTVSGRPRSGVNSAARALLALLGLAGSRCTASEVFAVLQQGPVARRFGLDETALLQVHDWLLESGFHWALDAEHRATFELPADGRHSLAQALQRLFLGYASPAQTDTVSALDADLLPSGNAEGTAALPLGALWQFVQQLQALHTSASQALRPVAWAALLQQCLLDFVQAHADELADLRELREIINTLADEQQRAAPDTPLSRAVLLAALQQRLDDPARGGVPTGQITFSSMSSLRGVPFEVVCVIGLNDGAFPTTPRPLEFDLMALAPRRGDRQRRSDERNVFLDLILAARRSLYLSHSGRSVLDNAPLPPSVLVSELLEVLLPAIHHDTGSADEWARTRQRLVVEHPLQPFALAAFLKAADPRLRSFDSTLCDALQRSLADAPTTPGLALLLDDEPTTSEPLPPFFTHPLTAPGEPWRAVSLDQLLAFFRNPCRSLLRHRLGLDLPREAEALQDVEPFLPSWSGNQALQLRLLPALLAGAWPEQLQGLARAGPEQPSGRLGEQQRQAELHALGLFAAQVQTLCSEPTLPPHHTELTFDLHGEVWTLQADSAHLRPSGQHGWRFDNTRAGDYVQAWLMHLVLCAAPAPGVQLHSHWLSRDGAFHLKPCGPAYAYLHELLALYRLGLSRPLHFFPKAAWAYVTADNNLNAAFSVWRTSSAKPFAEAADPAYRLAFRGQPEPLDAEFEALAQAVLQPLLQHLDDPRVRP